MSITFSERAKKDLKSLDKKTQKQILDKLEFEVSKDPDLYLKRLSGVPLYRIRIGNYRLICAKIFDESNISEYKLVITNVKHRSKAYRDL